ncbi:MAG: hypothetical protein Salg2KO_09630 [Salibacteraceae bacterium]
MSNSELLSHHFQQVFFGGNWTDVNLADLLSDITIEEATTKVQSLNTIADLAFHIDYYVRAVLGVFENNILGAHDKYSYDTPNFQNEKDWADFKSSILLNAEKLAQGIRKLDDDRLMHDFVLSKYGSYHRNIMGLIEHTHYHLGQISLILKMVRNSG